jgi:hypothetical protein
MAFRAAHRTPAPRIAHRAQFAHRLGPRSALHRNQSAASAAQRIAHRAQPAHRKKQPPPLLHLYIDLLHFFYNLVSFRWLNFLLLVYQ